MNQATYIGELENQKKILYIENSRINNLLVDRCK